MSIKIKKTGGYDEVEVKRFYLPYEIETKCPNCKNKLVRNFADEYLSYPNVGINEVNLYCEKCDDEDKDCEFSLNIELNMEIKLIPGEKLKQV